VGVELFQGECGLSMVEQGDGVEGGAVAGSVLGGDAQLVDDGEPFGSGGLVTAQAVDHRDRGGYRAEAGRPWAALLCPGVEEPAAGSDHVGGVAGEGVGHEEP
jgi:hypothetical protein